MIKIKKWFNKIQLALVFAAVVFLIFFLTICVLFAALFVLQSLGFQLVDEASRVPLFTFALTSLVMGTLFAFLFSRRPLKPIYTLGKAADQIAAGDYSVRVHLKGPKELVQLGERFNHMAEELGSVEMLRSDFVNNFSHEFKTPIVSIRGFAKILRQNDLTAGEREEYLDIIIEESERLSELAANVLNLSRIEQQTILTAVKTFNVSEQIRLVIAMLDSKWRKKQIEFRFDSGEIYLKANEELLKQVWINLLDNAVKFSPDKGIVEARIKETEEHISFTIRNQGQEIDEESAKHIFNKFYQSDSSHSVRGNGLGLPVVKKITELHRGSVRLLKSDPEGTVFEVRLPHSPIC